jgi:hypothetical protein
MLVRELTLYHIQEFALGGCQIEREISIGASGRNVEKILHKLVAPIVVDEAPADMHTPAQQEHWQNGEHESGLPSCPWSIVMEIAPFTECSLHVPSAQGAAARSKISQAMKHATIFMKQI